jgi:hypothetical protein
MAGGVANQVIQNIEKLSQNFKYQQLIDDGIGIGLLCSGRILTA